MEGPIVGELEHLFAELEARFERSLRLHRATIVAAVRGVTGMAAARIELLPW